MVAFENSLSHCGTLFQNLPQGCMDFKWSSPLLSHMDITCTPHGYHMHTSWVSHVHLMGITCTPHGYHMHTTWVSHVQLMGITCTPHGYHMYTSWVSHAHLMGITCTPHGYHMNTSWVSDSHSVWYSFPISSTGDVWILKRRSPKHVSNILK